MVDEPSTGTNAAAQAEAEEQRKVDKVELLSAILLGIAATLTAVSAFLSSSAGGEQLEGFNVAAAKLTDANFFFQQGNQTIAEDTSLFLAFLEAEQSGAESGFVTDLMSENLEAAIADWDANDDVFTPFDSELYVTTDYEEGQLLQTESAAALQDAEDAGARGDKLDLSSVVFATALFAGGVVNVFTRRRLQVALLVVGASLVVIGSVVMFAGL